MNTYEKKISLHDSGFDKIIEDVSRQHKESPKAKEIVPYEKSLELAKKMFAKYEFQICDNMHKDIDGWGEPYADYQKSIRHFLEKIPNDILERFQGHGIIRNSEIDRLSGALNILANKSIKGWCGRLGGETGGYGAYKDAEFLVISKSDKNLSITQERDGRQESIINEIGWKADIGAFVIDTKYYPMVEELKKIFPDVNIIKANELIEYLKRKD